MQKSFVLYTDSLDVLDELTDEQAGKLFKMIKDFANNKKTEPKGLLKIIFVPFKNQLIRDRKKYGSICERNRKNAIKRWSTKSTSGCDRIPKVPVDAYTDSDNDNDNDSDSDNEKKIKSTNVDFIQKKIAEKKIFSEEVQKLSDFLFECIKKNNPDFLGNPRKWDDAFDKMLRIDKRNQQMVGKVIQFAQEDNFWKTVILSGKKVRDKYEQLYMQAQQKFNNVVIIS